MKETKLSIDTGTFVRFWLVILGFAAAIGAIWLARSAVVTVIVAFFLALVLNRPVSFFARHMPGRSRIFATLIAYLFILALIVALFFNVVPIFVKQIALFLNSLPATLDALQQNSMWLNDFLAQYNLTNQYNEWIAEMQKQLGSVATSIGGSFVAAISGLTSAIVNMLFIAVLTFLMLIEGPMWEKKFWRLMYRNGEQRQRHQALARKMYDVVSGYVSGQAMVAVISATLAAVAVAILVQFFTDLELGLALTSWLVIFLMTFVPMFGAMIGGGVVTALLLLYSWPAALIFLVYFIIEQQIENNLIQPKIQSKRMNMSALLVLIAVLVGLQVAGIVGALVAIPVAGCIMVLLRDLMQRRRPRRSTDDDDNTENAVVFIEAERKYVRPKLPKVRRGRNKK